MAATIFSPLTLIGVAVFVFACLSEYMRFRREGPHLVVTEFRTDRTPEVASPIWVAGRPSGPSSWVSSLLGGKGGYVFRVSDMDITVEERSASDVRCCYLPLRHIASTKCDYRRPQALLSAAFFLCIVGILECLSVWFFVTSDDYARRLAYEALAENLALCLVLAMASYVLFQAGKRILIDVESRGGAHLGFSFKRGFAAGVSVDLDRALDLMEVLNNLVHTPQRSREASIGTT